MGLPVDEMLNFDTKNVLNWQNWLQSIPKGQYTASPTWAQSSPNSFNLSNSESEVFIREIQNFWLNLNFSNLLIKNLKGFSWAQFSTISYQTYSIKYKYVQH